MGQQIGDTDLRSMLAATADPQPSSAFFTVLPPEVRRMIYVESWRHDWLHSDARMQAETVGLKQHIIKQRSGRYTHSPCVVADQTGHDFRSERLAVVPRQQSIRRDIWISRVESDWAVHWPCEELYQKQQVSHRQRPTFMPALLTCKQMYLECIESIHSATTFVFTDTVTAEAFIACHPPPALRSIELCLRIHNTLPELYYPDPPEPGAGPVSSLPSRHPFDAHNNPWARLCRALARCTALRRLSIWLDIRDLRPWQDRVHERQFLEALFDVRVVSRGRGGGGSTEPPFVLALPRLDATQLSVQRVPGVEQSYLEGESLAAAPFALRRDARPNYWHAHLVRITVRDANVLTIDPGPG